MEMCRNVSLPFVCKFSLMSIKMSPQHCLVTKKVHKVDLRKPRIMWGNHGPPKSSQVIGPQVSHLVWLDWLRGLPVTINLSWTNGNQLASITSSKWCGELTPYSQRSHLIISPWGITVRSQWANTKRSHETNSQWAHFCHYMVNSMGWFHE